MWCWRCLFPLWYGVKHDIPVPGFCKYICPAGTFGGAVALLSNPNNTGLFGMLGVLFTRKFVILTVIALTCIFCYRSFCRFLCPSVLSCWRAGRRKSLQRLWRLCDELRYGCAARGRSRMHPLREVYGCLRTESYLPESR